jgi:hypothetical protein
VGTREQETAAEMHAGLDGDGIELIGSIPIARNVDSSTICAR